MCGQNSGAITGCTFSGSVSVSSSVSSTVGGVCGLNVGTVSNCLNTGAVAATGGASYNYVGGICGQNGDRSESGAVSRTVENCLNTGNVTMDGNGTNIGGVYGYNSATVTNCCYYLADDVLLTTGIDAVGGGEGTVKDTAGTSKE